MLFPTVSRVLSYPRFLIGSPDRIAGATYADITVRGRNIDTYRNMVLHALYLSPQRNFRETETEHFFQMLPNQEEKISISVRAGTTLELCMGQYWNSLGTSTIDLDCVFRGVSIEPAAADFVHAAGALRVDLYSPLRAESLNVRASLSQVRSTLKPVSATVQPLFAQSSCGRDMLWEQRPIHGLLLSYEFELKEAMKVCPGAALLNDQLYESAIESQLVSGTLTRAFLYRLPMSHARFHS